MKMCKITLIGTVIFLTLISFTHSASAYNRHDGMNFVYFIPHIEGEIGNNSFEINEKRYNYGEYDVKEEKYFEFGPRPINLSELSPDAIYFVFGLENPIENIELDPSRLCTSDRAWEGILYIVSVYDNNGVKYYDLIPIYFYLLIYNSTHYYLQLHRDVYRDPTFGYYFGLNATYLSIGIVIEKIYTVDGYSYDRVVMYIETNPYAGLVGYHILSTGTFYHSGSNGIMNTGGVSYEHYGYYCDYIYIGGATSYIGPEESRESSCHYPPRNAFTFFSIFFLSDTERKYGRYHAVRDISPGYIQGPEYSNAEKKEEIEGGPIFYSLSFSDILLPGWTFYIGVITVFYRIKSGFYDRITRR